MSEPKKAKTTEMDNKCINTIRMLAADTVQKANSGHPGAPMGCAPMAFALWKYAMNYSPANPDWSNRDRFVLSNGHACALQYTMLHLLGYNVSVDDLKQFRQIGSITPGHPENHVTDGIEVSTGPLGQGISNAVGLALAESHLAGVYNKPGLDIVDHYTYVICGDGCLQEGVSAEASSFAGHNKLGKLIVLYDDNHITIDGSTDLSFGEDVLKRYESYGWHTSTVENGNSSDLTSLRQAIEAAKAVTDKPSMIKVTTIIGFGSAKEGTHSVHGAPLGDEDIANAKSKFDMDPEKKFFVADDVQQVFAQLKSEGAEKEATWNELFAKYKSEFPELANEYERALSGELPEGWDSTIPEFNASSKKEGSRKYSQKVLASLVDKIPELIGGSADLTPSNNTKVAGNELDYSPDTPNGKYIRYGVREHGMSAIANGLAAHGGIVPFVATFLTFAGYALGAIRLSALSHFRVLYIMTHDSPGLGEDGPTHQPVETYAHIRALPNIYFNRPADGTEVAAAYKLAMTSKTTPSVIALSRQGIPNFDESTIEGALKGAYVLKDAADAKLIIAASGSEVSLSVEAANALAEAGIPTRVVSFPCWSLFDAQSQEYKDSVFTPGVPVLSVEAANTQGWAKYSHAQIGIDTFGMSGPGAKVLAEFGFTVDNVVEKAQKVVEFYKGSAPALLQKPF